MRSINNKIKKNNFYDVPLIFIIALFAANCLYAADVPDSNKIVFGDIQVIRLNVFDTLGGKLRRFQQLANKLHMKSRDLVIKRELLFSTGTPFQPDLLKETERNLRKLQFIGRVSVTADQSNPYRKNVTVVTQDQWSTAVDFSAGREGGRNSLRFGISEQNLLGLGQNLSLRYKILSTGNFIESNFDDARFFNTRWALHLQKVKGSDRNFFLGEAVRPLYSLDSRWAAGFSIANGTAKSRWYEHGEELDAFRLEGTAAESFLLRSFGSRYDKTNLRFGYAFKEELYSPYWYTHNVHYVTPDDRYHQFSIGLERDRFSYAEEIHLDRFQRTEDIKLGRRWYGEAGIARRQLTPLHNRPGHFYHFQIGRALSVRLPSHQYFFGDGNVTTRVEKGNLQRTITGVNMRYYNRILPNQTIAVNLAGLYGHKLDAGWQYVLGEDNGLRGSRSFRFAGQKLLLMNVEDRIFTPWQILWTGIGAAVFADGGYVWKSAEPVRFHDLRFSIGAGLRFSLNKSTGSSVLRIDFAKPVDGSGFQISVSDDHIFLINPVRQVFRFPGMVF